MSSIIFPLIWAAQRWPNATAVINAGQNISYQKFLARVLSAAAVLKQQGIRPRERVAVLAVAETECLILLWALMYIQAVSCLLDARWPSTLIRSRIRAVNSRWLIGTGSPLKNARWPGLNVRSFVEIVNADLHYSQLPARRTQLNNAATILFTSGTTRQPKAVVHTLGNHYYSALGSNHNIPLKPDDRWLLSLPLYHVSGLSILFRCALNGGTVVVPGADETIPEAIRKHKVTHLSLVPTQLYRIFQNKRNIPTLKPVRAILLGGSAISPGLLQSAKKLRLPVYPTYGLTEMASQVVTGGKILKYRQLKLAGDGEILVKGQTLFQGYWQNGKLVKPLTKGWLRTGDIGQRDAKGKLSVIGRKDNMFISGGENIYPEEIERELLNYNGIRQALVVAKADQEFGHRPVAFVDSAKQYSNAQLTKFLEKRLPRFKIPVEFRAWPSLKITTRLKPLWKIFSQCHQI